MHTILYTGGKILPLDTNAACEAMAVRDGRVLYAGSEEDVRAAAGKDAEIFDLEGDVLMPSFIDAHSHLTAFAATLRLVPLGGCKSFEDVAEKLRERCKGIVPDEWVIGFGYDHNELKEKRHPDKALLDAVSGRHPIMISHASGHMGVVNTPALRLLHIDKSTKAPAGGKIGWNPDGQPNGYLEEQAFIQCSDKIPQPDEEEQLCLLQKAQEAYFSYGITTIQDGKTGQAEFNLLKKAAQQGILSADVIAYANMMMSPDLLCENPDYRGQYLGHLRLGGYKLFLDGSPQGRTAWMEAPYRNAPDSYRGYPAMKDEELYSLLWRTVAENAQILAHVNGDAACRQYIEAYQKAYDPQRDIRPVLIHAQFLRPDQLPAVRALRMIPSFFAAHVYHWGDVHIENFGLERAARISPLASALREGIPFTLHQDTPVIAPDMLETIWCAANRMTRKGVLLGKGERIGVYEALRAATVNAAYQYHEEAEKGTLSVGKRADFIRLNRSPLAVPKEEICSIRIKETYKDGNCVWQAQA